MQPTETTMVRSADVISLKGVPLKIRSLLQRAAALVSIMAFAVGGGVAVVGPSVTTAVAVFGAAWVALAPTPARADCLLNGQIRRDISNADCLEAQRTGCVRGMLTGEQYINCLRANEQVQKSGQACIIGGVIRNDLSARDCREAKSTGCVRRLLTATQYENCLNAQLSRQNCVVGGVVRNDLKGLDCDEAKATGCVRRLLTPAGYERCLAAQRH
jgi:hypothetical protein